MFVFVDSIDSTTTRESNIDYVYTNISKVNYFSTIKMIFENNLQPINDFISYSFYTYKVL